MSEVTGNNKSIYNFRYSRTVILRGDFFFIHLIKSKSEKKVSSS